MKITITHVPSDGKVEILGHTLGLQDIREAVNVSARIKRHSYDNERDKTLMTPKNPVPGLYILELYEPYPCFDSYDYASESRYYSNFFFSTKPFTYQRVDKIGDWAAQVRCCNWKLISEMMPGEYLPAVYFEGESRHPLIVATPAE